MAEPKVVSPLSEGVPDLQQAGVDAAPVVLAKRLPLDLLPRVAGEDSVVVEGGDEVVPGRTVVPVGGARHALRIVYRNLKSEERNTFRTNLQEWDDWAAQVIPCFPLLPHALQTKSMDKVMTAISDTFHNITSFHAHKPTKADKHIQELKSHIPPPTRPSF